jgi:choline-sulfatase
VKPPLVSIAIVLAPVGCGETRAAPPRPNVVLVVVDTLRTDRLPFHGCARDNAPFLGELAASGLVFERAHSAGAWTVPSTASLMTSVYPFQHGVVEGFEIEAPEDDPDAPVNLLPEDLETIPELFRAAGYRTFGVSGNALVGPEMGFARGFDRYFAEHDLDAATVNSILLEWRDEILDPEARRPWFVYLHYFDPHDNYRSREPGYDVDGLEAPDAESPIRFARLRAEIRFEEGDDPEYAEELAKWSANFIEYAEGEARTGPPRATIDRMLAAYDSEIRFMDEHLRTMLGELGALEDAVVVVTADHGEEHLDHGDIGHGQNLHDELVHVPLVVRLPGADRPVGRVAANVSTMDLLPTFRALLGRPPSAQDQGRDLLGPRREDRAVLSMRLRWPYPDSEDDPEAEYGVVIGPEKLIYSDDGNRSVYRLFDLSEDPRERHSLAGDRPQRVLELREEMERALEGLPRRERVISTVAIGAGIRAHMGGIGYAGEER